MSATLGYVDQHGLQGRASAFPYIQGSARRHLQRLVVLRCIAIPAQVLSVMVIHRGLGLDLPVAAMAAVIFALTLVNGLTWRRLGRARPVTHLELLGQLVIDVSAFATLLALAAGHTNAFGGVLLPMLITAACLPWTYTWVVAPIAVGGFSLLLLFFRPLFGTGQEARYLHWLATGLWTNYAMTVGMVAHFCSRIAGVWRRGRRTTPSRRENELCNEHLVRIGVLAAGAAHELAQPLSTMAVVIAEMEHRAQGDTDMLTMSRAVSAQLRNCQETLGSLLSYGRTTFDGSYATMSLDEFASSLRDAFEARRPGVRVRLVRLSDGPSPAIRQDLALRQGLLNLLGNAADVSPDWVEMRLDWDHEFLRVSVHDRGPGMPSEVAAQAGKLFFTTKGKGTGNGLGLPLAHLAAARLGGSLELRNEPSGGACAAMELPILDGFPSRELAGAAR